VLERTRFHFYPASFTSQRDALPNYIDGTPPPATAEKRTYKAIFKVGDARVGQRSDEVSITVGG
jgi:hypothetical protein